MIADYAPPLRTVRTRPPRLARWVLAGAAVVLAVRAGIGTGPAAIAPAGARTVVVAPGQSLWGIAEQQLPGDDPRVAIDEISQLNSLHSAMLQPGEVLLLPAH